MWWVVLVFGLALIASLTYIAIRLGRSQESDNRSKKDNTIKDKQIEEALNRPITRDELLSRLRDKRGL